MTTRVAPRCEICGSRGGDKVARDGRNTCVEHFPVPPMAEKAGLVRPILYDYATGDRVYSVYTVMDVFDYLTHEASDPAMTVPLLEWLNPPDQS